MSKRSGSREVAARSKTIGEVFSDPCYAGCAGIRHIRHCYPSPPTDCFT
jgi:hypothetical protein